MVDQPLRERLHDLDVAVFGAVAGFDAPALDRVLPPLSQAASYSRIWLGMSAVLAAAGGRRGRRTAITAVAALGATSALANLAVKQAARRRRPETAVPVARRLDQPRSTSFPSGHAASAAAFAGVVGHEFPMLDVPIGTLAATVAFSRVYTGVHYPGDVIAGWLLGRSVASVARATLRRIEPPA